MSLAKALPAAEAFARGMLRSLLAVGAQLAVYPAVGLQLNAAQHAKTSLAYAAMSVPRRRWLRRLIVRTR